MGRRGPTWEFKSQGDFHLKVMEILLGKCWNGSLKVGKLFFAGRGANLFLPLK